MFVSFSFLVSKGELAETANLIRKKILAEVRSGIVECDSVKWEVSMLQLDYKQLQDVLVKTFHAHLHSSN